MSGTLIVAIVALAVSSFSFAWQLAQYALTGARVRLEMVVGASDGQTVVHQSAGKAFDWNRMAAQGFTAPVVGMTIRNRGRLPISITSWAFPFETGPSVGLIGLGRLNPGKTLPHRLDAGAAETWFADAGDFSRAAAAWRSIGKEPGRLFATVDLATGKSVRSKNSAAVV